MKIQKITGALNTYSPKYTAPVKSGNLSCLNNYISVNQIPSENIKANFIPSFGKFKKIGEAKIIDRNTNETKNAVIKRETFGDSDYSYQLFVDNEMVGFMDLKCESLFPEDKFIITEPDDVFPEVKHIRTLRGDKYSGVGSALINVAIDESKRRGKNGALWLTAETGYAYQLSKYRQNESPIPFYYKLGFRAVDPAEDYYIQHCLAQNEYNLMPSSELLILTSETVKERNKYLARHYTMY